MNLPNATFHFTGAFFFITVLRRYFRKSVAVWITAVGAVLLEVYQWCFKGYYSGKELDTLIDLIADAVGIWMGAR